MGQINTEYKAFSLDYFPDQGSLKDYLGTKLKSLGHDENRSLGFQLAADELFTNAKESGEFLGIDEYVIGSGYTIVMRNRFKNSFDPAKIPNPILQEGDRPKEHIRGYGSFLVRSFCDGIVYYFDKDSGVVETYITLKHTGPKFPLRPPLDICMIEYPDKAA